MVISNGVLLLVAFAASLLLGVFGLAAASAFAAAAYYRTVGRGWSPTFAQVLAVGPVVAGLAIPFAVAARMSWWNEPSPAGDVTPLLGIVVWAGCGLLGSLLSWQVAGMLAWRPRSAGLRRRRHRYAAWARVIAILTLPGAALAWRVGGWELLARVLAIGFPVAAVLRILERRYLGQVEGVDRQAAAERVLYLRPFTVDQRMDVYVRSGESSWAENGGWVSLESFLADEMARRIGPLVALGSPRDVLPPGGGMRLYPADSGWQDEFKRLVREVKAVIMSPGDTTSIDWELRTIVDQGLHGRLFIITAPRRRPRRYNLPAFVGLLWVRAAARLSGWRPATWPAFANHLAAAGLSPGGDPGPGAVLGFDATGRHVVLGRGLDDAATIVGLIAGRLVAAQGATDE